MNRKWIRSKQPTQNAVVKRYEPTVRCHVFGWTVAGISVDVDVKLPGAADVKGLTDAFWAKFPSLPQQHMIFVPTRGAWRQVMDNNTMLVYTDQNFVEVNAYILRSP